MSPSRSTKKTQGPLYGASGSSLANGVKKQFKTPFKVPFKEASHNTEPVVACTKHSDVEIANNSRMSRSASSSSSRSETPRPRSSGRDPESQPSLENSIKSQTPEIENNDDTSDTKQTRIDRTEGPKVSKGPIDLFADHERELNEDESDTASDRQQNGTRHGSRTSHSRESP